MPRAANGATLAYLLAVLTTMPTECTTWPFAVDRDGYGWVHAPGLSRRAHIIVCTWYHGPRPKGMEVCHSCGNGHLGCFTPAHLRWDTAEANRAERRRTPAPATHCRRGHEYTPETTAWHNGHRRCRTCRRLNRH